MKSTKMKATVVGLLAVSMVLVGCSSSDPAPAPSVSVAPSVAPSSPSATPEPSASVAPSPNASPAADPVESSSMGQNDLSAWLPTDPAGYDQIDPKVAEKFASYGGAQSVVEAAAMVLQLQKVNWVNDVFLQSSDLDVDTALQLLPVAAFTPEMIEAFNDRFKTYRDGLDRYRDLYAKYEDFSKLPNKDAKFVEEWVDNFDILRSMFLFGLVDSAADLAQPEDQQTYVWDFTWENPKYDLVEMDNGQWGLKVGTNTTTVLQRTNGDALTCNREGVYYLYPNTEGNQWPWTIWYTNNLGYSCEATAPAGS